jgi:DNA-binding transcriptional LysR family regulator
MATIRKILSHKFMDLEGFSTLQIFCHSITSSYELKGSMSTFRRSIPSLTALATFEAAARLQSFTRAAEELGVTQAAVSRQIKLLEHDLNTALFLRAHRRVEATPAGAALASTVTTAFTRITEMAETLRQPHLSDSVTLGVTLAFSHFWLLPRLAEFRALHPDIKLKLVADDQATDLRRDTLDLAIRFGKPPFDDGISVALKRDEAFPVCSPSLLKRLGLDASSADIVSMPLIASDPLVPSWLTWRSWAKLAGYSPQLERASDASRLRFNHYTDAFHAAMNGEGVALGWAALISDYLNDGRLVRLGVQSVIPDEQHHLLVPLGRKPNAATSAFIEWISNRFTDQR